MYKFLSLVYLLGSLFFTSSFALDYDYGKAKTFKHAKRTISIIAGHNAYYPEQVIAYAGEDVEFYVTGTDKKAGCFMMPEKNIFLSAKKGELAHTKVHFDRPGVYKFYCPKGQMTGKVVVLLHPSDKKRRELREIASKSIIKVWRPREE